MVNICTNGIINKCIKTLAGERTFLSYCRTAILTLSFGMSLGRGAGVAARLLTIVAIIVANLLLVTGIIKYTKNKRALLTAKYVFSEYSKD